MRAEDSGSYSQNVYIFILNNSQPQVNSDYCTGVWTRHNLVIFYVTRKESSTKRTQQRIFWFWGTKSNGNTWEICIYRLWCLAAPIPATPIYRLREKCRPCVSTNEIPWKKKLKYVIMLCTALIFRTLRRINSVLNVQEKFKLSRKLSNDEVEGLYMWKCHCTMFHELLLLGKDMRSTASGFLFVMQIML